MKIIKYELLKFIKNKFCISLFIILLCMSSILCFIQIHNQDISIKDYYQIHTIVDSLSIEESQEYINDLKDFYDLYDIYFLENKPKEVIDTYVKKKGKQWVDQAIKKIESTSSNDIFKQMSTVNRVQDEIHYVKEGYSQFQQQLVKSVQLNQEISIFQNKDQSIKNKHILEQYEKLYDIDSINMVPSLGIEQFFQFNVPEILAIVFLIYLLGYYVYQEKKRGLTSFTQIMIHGKHVQYFAKLFSILFIVIIWLIISYCLSILIISFIYQGFHFEAKIQDIPLFMKSTINGEVWHLLLIFLFHKIIVFITIGSALYALSYYFSSFTLNIILSIIIAVGSFFIYHSIADLSSIAIFKYLNIYALFQHLDYFADYICFSFGNYVISTYFLFYIMEFIIILCSCLYIYLPLNNHYSLKMISFKTRKQKPLSLKQYENKKLWLKDKGVEWFMLVVIIQGCIVLNMKPALTMDDIYYNQMIDTIGNTVNETSYNKLIETEKSLNELMLNESVNQSYSSIDILQKYSAFEKYKERYYELQNDENAQLLKENEYRLLLEDSIMYKMAYVFIIGTLIMIINQCFFREKESYVENLQKISFCGRDNLFHIKIKAIMFYIVALNFILYGMIFVKTIIEYPTIIFWIPITYLKAFSDFEIPIHIVTFIILTMILRTIIVCLMTYILSYFVYKTKNRYTSLVVVFIVLLLFEILSIQFISLDINLVYMLISLVFYHKIILMIGFVLLLLLIVIYIHRKETWLWKN